MVSNIPSKNDPIAGCVSVCQFAMDLLQDIHTRNEELRFSSKSPGRPQPLDVRVGINCGPVVAGVVGTKRFMYDIWGDCVNIASRMESTGVKGHIQVTPKVRDMMLQHGFTFVRRGHVLVKGIGEMESFFLTGRQHASTNNGSPSSIFLDSNCQMQQGRKLLQKSNLRSKSFYA